MPGRDLDIGGPPPVEEEKTPEPVVEKKVEEAKPQKPKAGGKK